MKRITEAEAEKKMNFDEVLRVHTANQEEKKRVERTFIALFSLVCFFLITYIQLSDIQKSLLISKVFIIGQSIESFLTFFVTL